MRPFLVMRRLGRAGGGERGVILVEALAALSILGAVAIAFLGGLATSSRAAMVADERATAESLARSQMEWAKKATYQYEAGGYTLAPLPGGSDYLNYQATIAAVPLRDPDDGIQKITVTVERSGQEIIAIEGYKVDR